MENDKHVTNWKEITTEEAYRLSMAEFKGASMQAFQDFDRRLSSIETYNQNSRLISLFLSGIAGIVSGFLGGMVGK